MTSPSSSRRVPRTTLITSIAVATLLLLVAAPQSAQAQGTFEAKAKIGVASATIDQTAIAGDPIFNVGGGAQAAILLRFKGGIAAGFNFNYNYDSHMTSGAPTSMTARPNPPGTLRNNCAIACNN